MPLIVNINAYYNKRNLQCTLVIPLYIQIVENSLVGTVVGELTVSDDDENDLHSCSVTSSGLPFMV